MDTDVLSGANNRKCSHVGCQRVATHCAYVKMDNDDNETYELYLCEDCHNYSSDKVVNVLNRIAYGVEHIRCVANAIAFGKLNHSNQKIVMSTEMGDLRDNALIYALLDEAKLKDAVDEE